MSIELLQVMSAFYARSAFKFIELLPWLLLSFGVQFEVRVVIVASSKIVRWRRMPSVTVPNQCSVGRPEEGRAIRNDVQGGFGRIPSQGSVGRPEEGRAIRNDVQPPNIPS